MRADGAGSLKFSERLERVCRAHRVLTAWISKKCMIGRIGYLFLKLIQVVGEVCVLSDY